MEKSESERQYAKAYAVHHTTMNLHEALGLYNGIVAAFPQTKEADDSRLQIHRILGLVVPQYGLFETAAHLERSPYTQKKK